MKNIESQFRRQAMTTNLFKYIVVVTIIGLAFLAVNCSDKPDTGTHVHDDGTIHADEAPTSDVKTDDQGRSYHLHGDGSIHYLEPSESRVSGSTINMPSEEITKYDIGVTTAGPGQLAIKTILPGEIAINTDKMVHIVPRVPGMVREVKVKLGDLVHKGDVLAVIDSRDLADARAAYLASLERLELAQAMFDLKEKLWKKNISSEKEYLNTQKDLAQASEELFTRYEVVAPFDGTVIKKNIALGEILKDDAEVFVVADLRTVWINLQVYKKDLPLIRKGQHVSLVRQTNLPEIYGEIDYVGPLVGAQTQTALARVVLPNPHGNLRPGLFVKASVTVKRLRADVLIRSEYVQYLNDNPCIFIRVSNGFELRGVTLGDTDGEYVAITGGLKAGEKYATKNSFLLKAEMDESAANMHVHSDGTVHIEQKK
jgi:cobalt-zinc-cadmium efflux system membrane fusion protein